MPDVSMRQETIDICGVEAAILKPAIAAKLSSSFPLGLRAIALKRWAGWSKIEHPGSSVGWVGGIPNSQFAIAPFTLNSLTLNLLIVAQGRDQ